MTTETKVEKTEEISEVKKADNVQSDPSVTSILAELVKKQDERIDSFEKRFDSLETLIKEENANPVDQGVETENKPKTEDKDDVGDKVTIGNEVAPVPSDSQASIIAPALEPNKPDNEGLKMEVKADVKKNDNRDGEEKKEEKKEENKTVTKTDDSPKGDEEEKKKEKDPEMYAKSDETYEIVKTVRPKVYQPDEIKSVPTGYQILKATANGWGKTQSAEEALTIMYEKYENGEFGNGLPSGVY